MLITLNTFILNTIKYLNFKCKIIQATKSFVDNATQKWLSLWKETLKYNSRYLGYIRHPIYCSPTKRFLSRIWHILTNDNVQIVSCLYCIASKILFIQRTFSLLLCISFLMWKYLNCFEIWNVWFITMIEEFQWNIK